MFMKTMWDLLRSECRLMDGDCHGTSYGMLYLFSGLLPLWDFCIIKYYFEWFKHIILKPNSDFYSWFGTVRGIFFLVNNYNNNYYY